jgi:hypothetical protein
MFLSFFFFYVKIENITSDIRPIKAGAQRNIRGPLLYMIYIARILTYTAIISLHEDIKIATCNMQNHIELLENRLEFNKVEVNVTKCEHIIFALRKIFLQTDTAKLINSISLRTN